MLNKTIPSFLPELQEGVSLPRISGIYRITFLVTGEFYVGSSVCIENRRKTHLSDLRRRRHRNKNLQFIYDNYGESSLRFDVIEECEKYMLVKREQFYFDEMKPSINATLKVFGSGLGKARSRETRAKMSASQKGRTFTGEHLKKLSLAHMGQSRPMSEETKLKISLAQKGVKRKPISDEHRAAISAWSKGRKHTPETLLKMSAVQKGKKRTPETCARISASKKGIPRDPIAVAKTTRALKGRSKSPEHVAKVAAACRRFHAEKRAAKLSAAESSEHSVLFS